MRSLGVALGLLGVLGSACGSGAGSGPGPDAPPPDARISACGLPEPGSRCRTGQTLERCSGTTIEGLDCGAGTACAPDPAGGGGAACVAESAACGTISRTGACSGPIRAACAGGVLTREDCSVGYGTCGPVKATGESACTTACDLASVDAVGSCSGQHLRRCDFTAGAYQVVDTDCPAGTRCGMDPVTDGFACLPGCFGEGATGRCDGGTLVRCSGGRTTSTACADGETCAWGGLDGYACVSTTQAGARRVSGAVRFEDRPPGATALGELTPAPARGVAVLVVDDATGRALATAGTDEQGRYTLRFDAADGAQVHVLAVSATLDPARPARVLRPDGALHGFGGPSFAAAGDTTADLLVTEASGVAEALNILDVATTALGALPVLLGPVTLEPVTLVWQRGDLDGSFTDPATLFIHLLGGFGDDDGYDDAVIGHELGHFVEYTYGASDNPLGSHHLEQTETPTLAWSEGWATYFGSVVRGSPAYLDTNAMGGLSFDIDTGVHLAKGPLQTQNLYELTVSELLWDLGDGGPSDDDPVPGPHSTVTRVEPDYLANRAHDRAFAGLDLVDFLDGYLVLGGASGCAGLKAVLGSRTFPYDYAGPTPCP